MTDLAALGLSVRSDGVVVASDRLDRFTGASDRAGKGADGLGRRTDALGGALSKLKGIIGPLAASLGTMFSVSRVLSAAEQYETRMARVQAVITATGGAAGRTAVQLEAQAQALARASLESVDGVMNAQQVLLTFRNVQGEVFDRAIESAADLAAAMGQDIVSSTRQLARALEDPITGVTALTRSGTVFTEQQRDMIRAMVEAGRVADAQKFILDELEAQYGGVSRAASRLASAKDSLGQSVTNLLIGIADVTGATTIASAAIEALDGVVQFLGENIGVIRGMFIAAALALTVTYAPAIIAATVATAGWIASLVTLRTALIATGIGALVVGAGILIDFLIRLRQATGTWGEALSALGDLAAGVWEGIKGGAASIPPALNAVWAGVKAGFFMMVSDLLDRWSSFLQAIAGSVEGIPLFSDISAGLQNSITNTIRASGDFAEASIAASGEAGALRREAASLATEGFDKATDALARLRMLMQAAEPDTTAQAEAARVLAAELDTIGSGGGRAAAAVDELTTSLNDAEAVTFNLGDSLASVFTDALTGVKNLQDGLRDLLKQMASTFLNRAFSNILGNIFPSLGGISFGGGRERGGPVSAGMAYVVGEKRPELFVPGQSGTIIPQIPMGGGGTVVQVINNTGQPSREERQTLPDGRQIVRTIIGEEVGNGGIDRQMNGRFGLTPSAVRR